MDYTISVIKQSLEDNGLSGNTVFVFASDNGGQANGGASNWPLRGGKDTLWEGGTRVPSFVYSELFDGASYQNTTNDWLALPP